MLRSLLLELVGTRSAPDGDRLSRLTSADWARLDGMAAQHRLQPLLHARHGKTSGVPVDVAQGWREAYRFASLQAMAQQADLAECSALLDGKGFAPIALKGAWLAHYAYPAPAQRPLRDIDLLLTPDSVRPAFETLRAAGYALTDEAQHMAADLARLGKHLPPLIAPRGTPVELHYRLWEPDGQLDHTTPQAKDDGIRARAVTVDGIRFPAPEDMLAHLIIHAVYSHRLDCGPLLLSDIAFLLAQHPLDWGAFWHKAHSGGWQRGARLVLTLVEHWQPETVIAWPESVSENSAPPAEILAHAPALLLQELGTRQSAGVMAALLAKGVPGLLRRVVGKRHPPGSEPHHAPEDSHRASAWSRLCRTMRELTSRDVRHQAQGLAALGGWLDQ